MCRGCVRDVFGFYGFDSLRLFIAFVHPRHAFVPLSGNLFHWTPTLAFQLRDFLRENDPHDKGPLQTREVQLYSLLLWGKGYTMTHFLLHESQSFR